MDGELMTNPTHTEAELDVFVKDIIVEAEAYLRLKKVGHPQANNILGVIKTDIQALIDTEKVAELERLRNEFGEDFGSADESDIWRMAIRDRLEQLNQDKGE